MKTGKSGTSSRAPIRIGAQGWNYDAWLGGFYPSGTRATDFLSVYARAFDTVEVDSTFYAIPPERTIEGWVKRTPDNFLFTLKLEHCYTVDELRGILPEYQRVVTKAKGEAFATAMVQRVQSILAR